MKKKINSDTNVHWEWTIVQTVKMSKLASEKKNKQSIYNVAICSYSDISDIRALVHSWGKGVWGQSGCTPPQAEFKNIDFVDTMISKVLRD